MTAESTEQAEELSADAADSATRYGPRAGLVGSDVEPPESVSEHGPRAALARAFGRRD